MRAPKKNLTSITRHLDWGKGIMSERKPLTGTNPSCGDLDKPFVDEGKEKKTLICSCFVRV